jgi:hypothetical protein
LFGPRWKEFTSPQAGRIPKNQRFFTPYLFNIFDERFQNARKKAFRLRHGIVFYVAIDSLKSAQLTLVGYRALLQFPVIHFDGWWC